MNYKYKKMPKMSHKDNRNPNIHFVRSRWDCLVIEHRYGEHTYCPYKSNFVCFDCEISFKRHKQFENVCTNCSSEMKDVGIITRTPKKGSNAWKNFKRFYNIVKVL